jgi:hypothetical protein
MRGLAALLVPVAALATALHYRSDLAWGVQAAAAAVPWSAIIGLAPAALLGITGLVVFGITCRYMARRL